MHLLYIIIIAFSLSMDTFSVSLNIGKYLNKCFIYSLFIGLLHLIFSIMGYYMGNLLSIFIPNMELFSFFVFMYIALNMILELNNETNVLTLDSIKLFLISIGVSIDSLGIGMTLSINVLLSSIVFCIMSFSFTYIGLILSGYLDNKLGNKFIYLGSFSLFVIGILHFYNFIINFI